MGIKNSKSALTATKVLNATNIELMLFQNVLTQDLTPLFLFLIIVTYVPILSTWLPTVMMGHEVIIK